MLHSAPMVVGGVDESEAGTDAARWATDKATRSGDL